MPSTLPMRNGPPVLNVCGGLLKFQCIETYIEK